MDFGTIGTLLILWFIILNYYGINGRSLSKEEDLELERQVRVLNKPAIETLQTKYGDTYNCVDFYQQPAFDNPLLKDHKYQFQMRCNDRAYNQNVSSRNIFKPENFWLNGKGCPPGTVPIRNVTKDDLIRNKLATKIFSSKFNNQNTNNRPGVKVAVLSTAYDPHKKYYGGSMSASLYNPHVQNNQYSSIQMKIQNGIDTIIVGSTVNPIVYKDSNTRLFTYTTAGDSMCFNNLCPHPLFVLTNTEIPLDMVFHRTSKRGTGKIYVYQYFIYKDAKNGNYFLELGDDATQVGFWPQKILGRLADSASTIQWGGEVYSPPNVPSPDMGSGPYPVSGSTRDDAFCSRIKVVNEAHQSVDPPDLAVQVDSPYEGKVEGNVGGFYQFLFFFGLHNSFVFRGN